MTRLFLALLLLLPAGSAYTDETELAPLCGAELNAASADRYLQKWWHWVQHADRSPAGAEPERRIKLITLFHRTPGRGKLMESADLTRPMPVTFPNGLRSPVIFASGAYAFKVRDGKIQNLLRGGPGGRRRIDIQFKFSDGRRMTGPYHSGSLPWDFIVVEWPLSAFAENDTLRVKAQKQARERVAIGYGGAMVQPHLLAGARTDAPKKPVQIAGSNYNPTRTRHAFEIEVRDETIFATDLGCLFGTQPSADLEWLSEQHEHGYGGRPFLNADGSPFLDSYGKGWMEYERVVREEIFFEDGRVFTQVKENGRLAITDSKGKSYKGLPPAKVKKRVPKITEIFARRLKTPIRAYERGELLPDGLPGDEEIKLMGVGDSVGPFAGAHRGGDSGHLVEGGNHFFLPAEDLGIKGSGFHGLGFSSGNFVDANTPEGKGYGALLGFRPENAGLLGLYTPVVRSQPQPTDFENFTSFLGFKYGITWGPGRPDFFKDHLGKWWMIAHGVPAHTLAARLPRGGWPDTPADFEKYARAGMLIPVHWKMKNGIPWLVVEDPPLPPGYKIPNVEKSARAG